VLKKDPNGARCAQSEAAMIDSNTLTAVRRGAGERAGRILLTGSLTATLALGLFVPSLPAAAQTTTAAFTTTAVVPQDVLAYMNIPLDEDSPQWTQATALMERAGFSEQLREVRDEGLDGMPLDAFLGGEAAIVITSKALDAAADAAGSSGAFTGGFDDGMEADALPMAPEGQGWAVVLDARAPDTAFAGLQAALEEQADEGGNAIQESEYQGVTITYAPPSASDDGENTGMATAQVNDLALIAGTPADLEPLIDAAQGALPNLADFEGFSSIQGELPAEFLLFGFFNGTAVDSGGYDTGEQLAEMGLDPALADLTAARLSGFTIAADPAGFRMETVAMNADGSPIPAGAANFSSTLAAKAPTDAIFFASAADLGRAGASGPDQPGLLEVAGATGIGFGMGMGSMGGDTDPATQKTAAEWVAEQYAGLAALLGFNIQTDLLQQLTGEYGIWVTAGGGDPSAISALIASGVADPGTVVNALTSISTLASGANGSTGGGVATRDITGGTVNVIETGPGAPAIEYGVVDGNLLIGVGGGVDQYAEASLATLADSELYQSTMAALPGQHNGSIYLDLSQLLPIAQALSSDTAGMVSGMGEPMLDADPSCADYATQEEAQAAYDDFTPGTEMLDSDFDGTVCEDFFNPMAQESDDSGDAAAEAADAFQSVDLSGIRAFGLVGFDEDGMRKSSSIILIAE
jgi:hypothetical protein